MGSSGPAWVLYRVAPSEVKTPKKREGNWETGSTHWGLRRGHSGSAGSSSPIEEGKQILITSSTSHTKGPERRGQEGWHRRRHRPQQLMKNPRRGLSVVGPTLSWHLSVWMSVSSVQIQSYLHMQVMLSGHKRSLLINVVLIILH